MDALFQPPESQKAPAGSTGLPPVPDMKSGCQTIIKGLFADGYDVEDEFKKIVSGLSVDGALTPAALKAAANNTEEMADRAYRLYVVTKFETDAYVRETDGIIGAMRDRATAELEKEKRTMVRDSEQKMKPQRSKQITDADVAAKAAQMFPDEWTSVDKRKQQAKLMTAYTEQLSSLHQSRCSTVRRLLPRDDS